MKEFLEAAIERCGETDSQGNLKLTEQDLAEILAHLQMCAAGLLINLISVSNCRNRVQLVRCLNHRRAWLDEVIDRIELERETGRAS